MLQWSHKREAMGRPLLSFEKQEYQTMGKHRSAAEIAAEKAQEAQKALVRAQREELKNSPEFKPLFDALQSVRADEAKIKVSFSGPQSFDNRIARHNAWIAEIVAARDLAMVQGDDLKDQREYLKSEIDALLTDYVSGEIAEDMVADRVADVLLNLPESDATRELRLAYEAAQNARRSIGSEGTSELTAEA